MLTRNAMVNRVWSHTFYIQHAFHKSRYFFRYHFVLHHIGYVFLLLLLFALQKLYMYQVSINWKWSYN